MCIQKRTRSWAAWWPRISFDGTTPLFRHNEMTMAWSDPGQLNNADPSRATSLGKGTIETQRTVATTEL